MARTLVARRCCSFMAYPVVQKPNRLRRPDGTWSISSRTSSLFALFAGGADAATLGDAGRTVMLDCAGCVAAWVEAGAATGVGCTTAAAGGGGGGAAAGAG